MDTIQQTLNAPFEVALLIIGAILVILGCLPHFKAKEVEVEPYKRSSKVILNLTGICLIISSLALALLPKPVSEKIFIEPVYKETRLDACLHYGVNCDETVATKFCRFSGFKIAVDWTIDPKIGSAGIDTINFGDNKICHGPECSGFKAITCSN